MIPIATLQSVRLAIVHGNCPDGRASAIILKAALPNIEVREVAYDSAEHRGLATQPGMLFCDFTPPPARVSEFVAAGAIVLDHHKGAADIVRAFGPLGVFADETAEPGVSGAMLAWREVYVPTWVADVGYPASELDGMAMPERELATLAGIRDTWQRSSPFWQRACEVSEVLRFVPLADLLEMTVADVLDLAGRLGPILWRKKLDTARDAAARALRLSIGGRRFAVLSSVALTSDVSDIIGDTVDVVAGFDYVQAAAGDRVRLQWSLRSKAGVDVSAIARRHGGNGHTAAAGFSIPVVDAEGCMFGRSAWNPYDMAQRLFAQEGAAA